MMWWHDSGWTWLWMTVMMVAFWAFIAVAIVVFVRALGSAQNGGWSAQAPARSPQDILAERYARGEIDSEEYQRRLHDIASHAAQSRGARLRQ
jgi:putative membrane protein